MSAPSTQEAFRNALKTLNDLKDLGAARTPEQNAELKAKMAEAKELKSQIETLAELDEVNGFAKSSAGMLTLSGGELPPPGVVTVTGMGQAGSTKIAYEQEARATGYRRSIELLDQYGEGIQSTKSFDALNTPDYRDAFKTYLRRGERGTPAAGLKILQEGIDTEGGLAA